MAFVKRITFGNNSTTTQTLLLYLLRASSTKRLLRQYSLAQYETGDYDEIVLSAGDAIQAVTTTASEVDYTVFGATAS